MVKSCVICKSTPSVGVQRSFHRLPYNREWKLRWMFLLAKHVGKCTIEKDSVLCSDHFSPDDYECKKTGKLKESAIPTLSNSRIRIKCHQIKKQIQINTDAKEEANNNPNRDLDEVIVKTELIIKDEVTLDDGCSEFTNTLIDSDVQMTDVKEVELCEDSKLNKTSLELETNCLGGTFDPGTECMDAVNSSNAYAREKTDTIVTVGNVVAPLVPKKSKALAKEASSSDGLTNITIYVETVDRENVKKSLEAEIESLKYYIKNVKVTAKDRENQLESKLRTRNLCIDKLEREIRTLTNELYHVKQDHQMQVEITRKAKNDLKKSDKQLKATEKLKTNNEESDKQLKQKTSECLDYKNRLLNVCQELAHVKVKLTNCEEEKTKLEKNLGLEEMRKEIDVLKKNCQDMYESHRLTAELTAIKENELNQEILSLKAKLKEAKKVCWLLGLRSEDLSLEKAEEQILNCKEFYVPKCWESRIKTRRVKAFEKKTNECTQLKKELDKLKRLSDNHVCEYCGL